MINKRTLFVGVGAGYLLGAKAGTERYEQIKRMVANLMGKPTVQHATETLHHTATGLADKAKNAVHDRADKLTSKTVDLTDKTPKSGAGATIE